jgi:hypothetical protein
MLKFAPVLLAFVLADYASAFTTNSGEWPLKQKLGEASNLAFAAVGDIASEINYIKSAGETAPSDGCSFCTDDPVEENDGDVIEHLNRISNSASDIGELALKASQQSGGVLQSYAKQACDLTRSVLNDIPAAKATISWQPIGVARPQTFDATQSKLQRVKSLLPSCF